MKVNTDDVAVVNGKGGCGKVFRNRRGFVFGCSTILLSGLHAFEAQLFTAIYGVELAAIHHLYCCGLSQTQIMWFIFSQQ